MNDDEFRSLAIRELRSIKWIIAAALVAFLIFGCLLLIGAGVYGIATYQKAHEKSFQDGAEEMLGSGEFTQLRSSVSARLNERPNDIYALYYLARADLHDHKWKDALKTLERIEELEPSWSEYLMPFVELARANVMHDTKPD